MEETISHPVPPLHATRPWHLYPQWKKGGEVGGLRNYGITNLRNSSTLTLSCDLLMNRLAEIRIKPGATLIVNGTIHNANIKPEPGSTLILNNGGRTITHRSDDFVLPTGAKLQINNGTIE